jgi:hypothetical protein
MGLKTPSVIRRWKATASDPWRSCERADWLVYLASDNRIDAPRLIRAMACSISDFNAPSEYEELAATVRLLVSRHATGSAAPPQRLVARLVEQVREWNRGAQQVVERAVLGEQWAGGPVIPPPPPSVEPLRRVANIALKLDQAATLAMPADEPSYELLALVALHLVHLKLGRGQPLYNHIEMEDLPDPHRAAHRLICDELRSALAP